MPKEPEHPRSRRRREIREKKLSQAWTLLVVEKQAMIWCCRQLAHHRAVCLRDGIIYDKEIGPSDVAQTQ